MMDNISNKNTSSSSGYPQMEMVDNIDSFSRNWPLNPKKCSTFDILVILSIISSLGYPEEGFVFILVIMSIISSLGYPEEGFVFILVILSIMSSLGYPEDGFVTLPLGILKRK
jgi:hypothetical protein